MSRRNNNRGLGNGQGAGLHIEATSTMRSFSGPIPPAEELARYDHTLPGAADRIISMAERQHQHRQALESAVVMSNISAQTRGTYLGFFIAVLAIGGGIYLITIGKSAAGLTAIITALGALVGTFVYGKRRQKKELDEKAASVAHIK